MTGKMIFSYQFNDGNPKISVELSPESALPEVLEAFESFLIASGYKFTGQLDFVDATIVEEN